MKYIKLSYAELAWIIYKLGNFQFIMIKPIQEVIHMLTNKMPNGDIYAIDDDVFIQDSAEDIFYQLPTASN